MSDETIEGQGALRRAVACIIPSYREDLDHVRRTLDSALAVDRFTHIVIVDDTGGAHQIDGRTWHGDTRLDALAGDHAGAQVIVLHLAHNRGAAAAMNVGVYYMPEDAIIARLDVGDVFIPDAKARQIDRALAGELASFTPHYDAADGDKLYTPPANWQRVIYTDGAFCICTCVVTRAAWADVEGFDEALRYGDDWDFAMRLQHAVGWTMYDEPTCSAGAFEDGHTKRADRDPELAARKVLDTQQVYARGQQFAHPASVSHLSNPKWLKKRGLL